MSDTVRIGFIGAGANTVSMHLPNFQAIDGVEIACICNRSEASSLRVANKFGIKDIAAKWEDVVNDPSIDAICIGTWPYLHAEATIAGLMAGKHVLTEARMAMNLRESRLMAKAARFIPDLVAQIVPSPFTLNYDSTIRRMMGWPEFGELREIRVRHLRGGLLSERSPMTWRQDSSVSGKNILTVGIFHEAVLRWVDSEVSQLAAWGKIHVPKRKHWDKNEIADVDLPDQIHILGQLKNGVLLDYKFSGVEPGANQDLIELVGSRARLRLSLDAGTLELVDHRMPDGNLIEIPDEERRGWRVEQDFIDSIREKKPVELTSFAKGVEYMRFTEAVYDSWKKGGQVVDVSSY